MWGQRGWVSCGQGSSCAFFLCPTGPGRGPGSPIKGPGLEPKPDFSLCGSARSCRFPGLHFCLLKPIGKVNEINMARHCGLPRRRSLG